MNYTKFKEEGKMKKLIIFFSLIFITNICYAKNNLYIEIIDYGIYSLKKEKSIKPEGKVATGKVDIVTNIKLIKETTDIPGKLDTNFGFRFIVKGGEKGKKVKLLYKFLTPPLYNPETKKIYTEQYYYNYASIGKEWVRGYSFKHPWEIVAGKWVFQIYYKNEKLAEKVFYVHK